MAERYPNNKKAARMATLSDFDFSDDQGDPPSPVIGLLNHGSRDQEGKTVAITDSDSFVS